MRIFNRASRSLPAANISPRRPGATLRRAGGADGSRNGREQQDNGQEVQRQGRPAARDEQDPENHDEHAVRALPAQPAQRRESGRGRQEGQVVLLRHGRDEQHRQEPELDCLDVARLRPLGGGPAVDPAGAGEHEQGADREDRGASSNSGKDQADDACGVERGVSTGERRRIPHHRHESAGLAGLLRQHVGPGDDGGQQAQAREQQDRQTGRGEAPAQREDHDQDRGRQLDRHRRRQQQGRRDIPSRGERGGEEDAERQHEEVDLPVEQVVLDRREQEHRARGERRRRFGAPAPGSGPDDGAHGHVERRHVRGEPQRYDRGVGHPRERDQREGQERRVHVREGTRRRVGIRALRERGGGQQVARQVVSAGAMRLGARLHEQQREQRPEQDPCGDARAPAARRSRRRAGVSSHHAAHSATRRGRPGTAAAVC
jgi:hypothetical protein